jgi:hypothetical protein
MRDDSEVFLSTAQRAFILLPLVACFALACERDEAPPTSAESVAPPTGATAPSTSELYVDADGTVEPAGAMDELIALACGDGPVPDDLEIVFYDGIPEFDPVGRLSERGLYAGNRVVHYAWTMDAFDYDLSDHELSARVVDPTRRGRPAINAQFPIQVRGRLPATVRRKLWCLTAHDLARLGPVTDPNCRWRPGVRGEPSIRISTGGRTWRRRMAAEPECPFDSFDPARRRFDHYVTRDRFDGQRGKHHNRLPKDLVEVRARVVDECEIPPIDFVVELVLDANGAISEMNVPSAEVPVETASCIADVVSRGDYSVLNAERVRTGFQLAETHITLRWVGGFPYMYVPMDW